MYDLKDKVVLITGAAGGLGAAVVRKLLEEGVKHVAVLDVAKAQGEAFQNELNAKYGANKVKFYECDITDEDAFLRVVADVKSNHGYIDVVINNAGVMNDSWQVYKKEIMVNVSAVVTISLRALKMMRRDEGGNGGTIINISSLGALSLDFIVLPVYAATKTAVLHFSNSIGLDGLYSRTGVRVITVCPGVTNTSLLSTEKSGIYDNIFDGQIEASSGIAQKVESAAQGIVDVYKRGESASTWLVAKNEPAKDITADINKSFKILSEHAVVF